MWQKATWALLAGCLAALAHADAVPDEGPSHRRIVVILAPPAGGAGTNAPYIEKALGIPHIDAGQILRAAAAEGTTLGLEAKRNMDAGKLVPNSIVNGVIASRLQKPDCAAGMLLDGYPRDVNQSEFLDGLLAGSGEAVTDLVLINVPTETLRERILGRWVAPNGNTYNTLTATGLRPKSLPPGAEPVCDSADLEHCNMFDDESDEPLFRRGDDTWEALKTRISEYHRTTQPILARYRKVLLDVDGDRPEPQVWADIAEGLGVDPSTGLAELAAVGQAAPVAHLAGLAFIALSMLGAVIGTPTVLQLRSCKDDSQSAHLDYQPFLSPTSKAAEKLLLV